MAVVRAVLGYFGLPALFFGAFFASYKVNRTSLVPSFFFTGFLAVSALLAVMAMYSADSDAAKIILLILMLVFLSVFAFGGYALLAFLFLNAVAVLRREKRTLANSLTLLLALAIIAFMIFAAVVGRVKLSAPLRAVAAWIEFMALFYAVHVAQFMTASVLCNLSRPRKNQDFIIVHGAWLKDGNVSPLLAKRVDRAIKFYREQEKTAKPPKLILSGGQGTDEKRSEAEAMAEYARAQGIPEEAIIMEAQSKNTLENMRFSKAIMDAAFGERRYNAIYATSGYHLLRTGIYARNAGMKISGIGSKTAFYYLPVAFLREYIAYIVMHKKRNIVYAAAVLLLSCGLTAIAVYFS